MEFEQAFSESIYNCLTSCQYAEMDWMEFSPSRS